MPGLLGRPAPRIQLYLIMCGKSIIGVNYRHVFPGLFRDRFFSACICAAARAGCGGERRAVVWPVSCLGWGRACPGGRTLVLRRPGRSCPALMGPAWPPGLARRGSRTWEVGKEPPRAKPGTGYCQKRARTVSARRRSRCRSHASPQSHQASRAPRVCGSTLCDDCAGVRSRADVPRCGRKEAVIVTARRGGELFEEAAFDGAGLVSRGADPRSGP